MAQDKDTDSYGSTSTTPFSRIVGGQITHHQDWPSLVAVYYKTPEETLLCGGTVIAPDWVLTAGHCAQGKEAKYFSVLENTDDLQNPGPELHVGEVLTRSDYTTITLPNNGGTAPLNDIALLHLTGTASSPPEVLLSDAASPSWPPEGMQTMVAGFGLTSPQPYGDAFHGQVGTSSNELREVALPLVGRAACAEILAKAYRMPPGDVNYIDKTTLCAGDPINGGKDSCNGDSGGPLVATLPGGARVQVGIVSWGPGCAQQRTVGVYTDVGHFEKWIRAHVASAQFASPSKIADTGAGTAEATSPRQELSVAVVEGGHIKVGELIHVRVTSTLSGQLLVYNVDTVSGKAYQIYPNAYLTGGGTTIGAGTTITIPGAADAWTIRVAPPMGMNKLYAFVVPPNVHIADITQALRDMREIPDSEALFEDLRNRGVVVEGPSHGDRASATFQYEIEP